MYIRRSEPSGRKVAYSNTASCNRSSARCVVEALELRTLLSGNWWDGVPVAESGSLPQDFVVAGQTAFFTADDGTRGRELWKTDGTTPGTQLVKDIRPGSDGIGTPDMIATADGSVMFVLSSPGSDQSQLWVSDGSDSLTQQVMSISTGGITALGYASGVRYFTVTTNDSGITPGLWRTDGTASGTSLVRPMQQADNFVEFNGQTYFFGADETGGSSGLWQTDGTPAGTTPIASTDSLDGSPVVFNGAIYFITESDTGPQLWSSDGTAGGTQLIQSLPLNDANQPVVVGSDLFFGALEQDNTFSLWRSDGTASGTARVTSLPGSAPNILAAGTNVYFAINVPGSGAQLWRSDGSAAGTIQLKTIAPAGQFVSTRDLTALGSSVYFTVPFGSDGVELWKTDGSISSTTKVATLNLTPGDTSNAPPIALGNTLMFDAFTPITGWELNTTAGMLANINTQHADFAPSTLIPFRNKTSVFTADDGIHGRELWLTDGTAAGTSLVQDIWPGNRDSGIRDLTVVSDVIYFVANDGSHGEELWKSDGTSAGTALVADRSPGLASSNITGIFNVNGIAHFADSGTLYRIDPSSGKIGSVSSIAPSSAAAQASSNGNWYFLSDLQTVSRTTGDGAVQNAFTADQQMDQASLDVTDGNIVYTGHVHRVAPSPPNQKIVQTIAPAIGSTGVARFSSLRSGVIRVHGTEGDDAIDVALDDSDASALVITLNGQTQTYQASDVRLIIVYANAGDDLIEFGSAHGGVKIATKLYGAEGNDTILGGATRDRVYGGEGNDSIVGNSGHDIIYGEAGDDTILGANGNDYLVGGTGADEIQGNKGHDRLFIDTSVDTLVKDRFDLIAVDPTAV